MMRAFVGSMFRKSRFSAKRASSAIDPASSTPVGPPPTSTKVSKRRRRPDLGNSPRAQTQVRAGAGSQPRPEGSSGWERTGSMYRDRSNHIPHRSPARDVVAKAPALAQQDLSARRIHTNGLIEPNRHVACVTEDRARRLCDFVGRERRSSHLVQQRLKKVVVAPIDQDDANWDITQVLDQG